MHVDRSCGDNHDTCPDAEKTCSEATKKENLKACAGACCMTDGCNNFTPGSSATGIGLSKITSVLMVVAGLLAL